MQPNAVLLAGELRFTSFAHVARFKADCKGTELFIVTYSEYETFAWELLRSGEDSPLLLPASQRLHLLNRNDEPALYHSVYQWRHLDTALKLWRSRLSSAPLVLRHRTDSTPTLTAPWAQLELPAGAVGADHIVFASTDRSFYAKGSTFIDIFSDMYPELLSTYGRRLPTKDEAITYKNWVEESLGTPINRLHSGCVLPGDPYIMFEGSRRTVWHSASFTHGHPIVAWSYRRDNTIQYNTSNPSFAVGDGKGVVDSSMFYSERAFAYHIIGRHRAKCMRLCLVVANCWTAPIESAPRYYNLLRNETIRI